MRSATALSLAVMFTAPASAQLAVVPASQLPDQQAFVQALDVGDFTIQEIVLPDNLDGTVQVQVSLDGEVHTLSLYRWSIRSTEHFEVLKQIADGSYVEVDVGESKIWHGTVADIPGSRISASIIDGQLDALIYLHDDLPLWGIQPANGVSFSYGPQSYVVYNSGSIISRGQSCGGAIAISGGATPPAPPSGGSFAGAADDMICEIACDADVEFYNKNSSSVSNTEADIENIIDRVQTIYQNDVGILYEITTIIVRTSEPDPYTSTSAGTLLNQFVSHWNSSQGGVQRDVAHLFTGKNINGGTIGIAFLNVICNLGSAYGLSESKFTGNIIFRTGLTAHELGHNWSAGHCDGQSDCKIMCSGIGGCAGSLTSFGNSSKNALTNKKNNANCLDDAVPPPPPVMTLFSSTTSSALGDQITVTGTNLLKVTTMNVGGTVISGNSVLPQSDNSLIFVAPQATSLGIVGVTATNPGGTSNSMPLNYVAANPPVLLAPTTINTFIDTQAVWTFAAGPGDVNYFLVDFDPGTFVYKGFSVLNTVIPVIAIPSNAAGVGTITIAINPSMGGVGLFNVYTQMAHFNPVIYGVSSVKNTLAF
jgi:hypothetical protein